MDARRLPGALFTRVALAVLAAWAVCFELSAILPSHPGAASVFGDWACELVQLAAAGLCAAGALRQRGGMRAAWLLIAAAIAAWTLGDVYWVTVLAQSPDPPVPSLADAGYLLFVPLVFAGLVILLHARVSGVPRTVVVDGIVVALAAATVSAAFIVAPIAARASGGTLAVATNLAYPIGDLALLGVVVAAIALGGMRPDPMWGLLGAGIVAFWVADSIYVLQSAYGTYSEPNLFDIGWSGSTILFAAAAWAPPRRMTRRPIVRTTRTIALPLALAFAAFAVALLRPRHGSDVLTVLLALACMAAVMQRLVMTFRQNVAMLNASRREALTDALTGLANRRALAGDLEAVLVAPSGIAVAVLAMFDLDGFKHYNDNFGHDAGDALLTRLGHKLGRAVGRRGTAYRVGGDEFCVLVAAGPEDAQPTIDAAARALSEHGEGFAIGCSFGVAVLPGEAAGAEQALRLADQRMYAAKNGGRVSAGHQTKEVLMRTMLERDAELASHGADVSSLAEGVARRLGLDAAEVEHVRIAAELHDIGKIAVPDEILRKRGPLDDSQWVFMREHTLVGQRIIAAAPSLHRVAAMVRSSHERIDGDGYPDGLKGDEIPLGARIVAVCDAFDAMVTDRSYRAAMGPWAAISELCRCAGTQFDAAVVEAFRAEWVSRQQQPAARAA